MKTPRKASPARSQGPMRTPIRHKRRTLSVTSARSSASVIISALTQQRKENASFVVSPLGSRKSILSDNTEIEEPRRNSWWKNLRENSTTSRDLVELLEENENREPNNFIEELDMEILSQENKMNYTLELPESSDNESINSIVITQRKLFPQRKNQEQKHYAQIVGSRESLAKQNETVVDKTIVTGTRELFQNKQRTRPIFPAALLNISPDKTVAEKTPKVQVRNIFGQHDTKRKNIFTNFNNFIVESEDEIPDIQPKVFDFLKKIEESRRSSLHDLKSIKRSKDMSQEIENEGEPKNESEVAPDEVDNASDNEEENDQSNKSQAANEIDYESYNEDEKEKNLHQNETVNASDNEVNDLSLEQNQSEPENESQEVEDDNEENQNEMHVDSDTELNESQIQNESYAEQNESEAQNESNTDQNEGESQVQNESDTDQNESNTDQNEGESQVQNESNTDQNESNTDQNEGESQVQNKSNIQEKSQEVEEDNDVEQEEQDAEQNESVVQDEEQNVKDSPDNSHDKGVESENQEESAVDEIIETPNVSHDTTGRNRKKNKSPEAVLHDSRNLIDSYYSVKGDKTVRKTEMPKSTHRDLVPARESLGFSDGSTPGSGWDSHRTTRKTLRLTYGRDFTPRKSLRALVMEKSAKRQTQHNDMASFTEPLFPQANSTEIPSPLFEDEDDDENENISPNDISLKTRQTTIEKYLMGVAEINAEIRKQSKERVLNSLKEPPTHKIFKIPVMPLFRHNAAAKPKQSKSAMRAAKVTKLFGGELPQELLEDLMYKPPKRFQPRDAPWITKHLYKFLETKLEPKYKYKSRVRAERLVENVYNFTKDLRRRTVAPQDAVEVLKREMARLRIVKTHHDFYEFFGQFMPRDVRRKVMPDLINNIKLPRQGVFSDIL